MVSLNADEYLTLKQAAKYLPGRPHISTIHRWRLRGVGGVKLETIKIGGRRFVTHGAIREFIRSLNSGPNSLSVTPSTNRQREEEIRKAEEELARAGI